MRKFISNQALLALIVLFSGAAGGQLLAEGTPEDIVKASRSYTGQFLQKVL